MVILVLQVKKMVAFQLIGFIFVHNQVLSASPAQKKLGKTIKAVPLKDQYAD